MLYSMWMGSYWEQCVNQLDKKGFSFNHRNNISKNNLIKFAYLDFSLPPVTRILCRACMAFLFACSQCTYDLLVIVLYISPPSCLLSFVYMQPFLLLPHFYLHIGAVLTWSLNCLRAMAMAIWVRLELFLMMFLFSISPFFVFFTQASFAHTAHAIALWNVLSWL